MRRIKENEYGVRELYEIGDEVRVWKIFKHPSGKITEIVDSSAFPMIYKVKYIYEDTGESFEEDFEATDLTLIRKKPAVFYSHCECGSELLDGPAHTINCPKHRGY